MSLLHEIAVRAKWDGSFTQEWATIRSCISREGGLEKLPGRSDLQKLQAWAEKHGLVMDFDFEFGGFSSEIRSVTFWNHGGSAVTEDSVGSDSAEKPAGSGTARNGTGADARPVGAAVEYFDWDAVDCR